MVKEVEMGLSILIDDDSKVSRMILKKELPPGEYVIREASGGEGCLRIYRDQKADLVFLDKTKPGLDGLETFALLKELDPLVNDTLGRQCGDLCWVRWPDC